TIRTVANPSFGPRQAVSNLIQSAVVMGNNAFRAFDPRTLSAAAMIAAGRTSREIPRPVVKWINDFADQGAAEALTTFVAENAAKVADAADLAKGLEMKTVAGTNFTRDEIEQLAQRYGVVRGTAGISGEAIKRSLQAEIGTGARTGPVGRGLDATK